MPYVQQRRGTAAELTAANEIPLAGQIYLETDTGKIKIGNGTATYSSLEYITDASNIADGAIATNHLIDSSVTVAKVADNAISEAKIQNLSVTTSKVADGAVTSGKIADGTITAQDMATHTVDSARISPDAVVESKIAANAVTETKIANDAVTYAKLQNVSATDRILGRVSTGAGDVQEIHCTELARNLLNDANKSDMRDTIEAAPAIVSTTNIANDAVTYAKLQNVTAGKILGNEQTTDGNVEEINSTLFGRSLLNVADGASLVTTLGVATSSEITAAINNVIDSAPGALDTLNELAAAIGDDASFSTTVTNSIAAKMPLAGGTFTGEVVHQAELFSGFYAVGTNILDAATIASGNGDRSLLNDATTIAKVREIEFARGKRVAGLTNVSNVPSSNQTNYNSPADNKHWQWTGSAWQQVEATDQTWIGQYSTVVAHDWGQTLSDDTNAETKFQRILLYENGASTDVAGMGISTSNFNIGTKGGINVSFYAQGNLNERKTGSLSRHYVDQFFNQPIYTAAGSATLPAISKEGDVDTGIYYPSLGAFAITADGDEKIKVTNNQITVSRTAGYPTIKADATGVNGAAGGWLIIDSVSNPVSLNHYSSADVSLAYGGGGVTVGTAALGSYKFRVHGGTAHFSHDVICASGAVHSQFFRADNNGATHATAYGRSGDPDTGMYFPGTNEVALVAGGDEVIKCSSAGITTNNVFTTTNAIQCTTGSVSSCAIQQTSDGNTGIIWPAADKLGLVAGGVEFIRGATTGSSTVVSSSHLIDTSNNIYANGYFAKNAGSASFTAFGRYNDADTGMYFPAANQVGISSGGNDRVNFNANASTFYRNGGQPTIKADTGNSGWMIIDSASNPVSINHFNAADIILGYHGTGNTIVGRKTDSNGRKFYVKGSSETETTSYSNVYLVTSNGTAAAVAYGRSTDSNTGMYFPDVNKVGLAAGGGTMMTLESGKIEASQPIRVPDGNNIFPAINFANATTTGFTYQNSNLNLVYAQSNRISIGASAITLGNVPTTIAGAVSFTQKVNVSNLHQSGATSGQSLQWNGSAWVPVSAGGAATSITGNTDVAITGTPSDNSLLRYDAANSKWENYNPDGFTTSGGGNAILSLENGNKFHKNESTTADKKQ